MKVELDGGEVIDLGTTETTPTIGIIDYSRRVTDDFGVTTVVERGFARRMSTRMMLPFTSVDSTQLRLADLRATAALWIADDRFDWLSFRGFYKDFSLDLSVPPVSYCTLEIEGLAASEPFTDPGGDPAPDGRTSTLQLLRPASVTDSVLASSSVAETDYPAWGSGTTYAVGNRVILASTHRIYESLVAANVGNDPAGTSGKWLAIGPTNRWSMFDQALGTVTSATGSIVVTLNAGAVDAVALLDVIASTVRVQASGYDRTIAVAAGAIPFLDLAGVTGTVTVTIAGSGTVSVGTLLIGRLVGLGITEASPTAGITDYSRKVVDDFGDVTIVPRAWAKRMSANALIDTAGVDLVANRIAAVRALPSLWIAQAGLDSLTIYGFFKDFSIEVGDAVSKLALTVEGLSTAAPIVPLDTSVPWTDITDPDGTKPEDNATVGAPVGTTVAGKPAEDVASTIKTGGGVDDNQVSTGALVANAATSPVTAFTAGSISRGGTTAYGAVQSLTTVTTGAPVRIDFGSVVNVQESTYLATMQVTRDGTVVWGPSLFFGVYSPITIVFEDIPAAGTHTYAAEVNGGGAPVADLTQRFLSALELKR